MVTLEENKNQTTQAMLSSTCPSLFRWMRSIVKCLWNKRRLVKIIKYSTSASKPIEVGDDELVLRPESQDKYLFY